MKPISITLACLITWATAGCLTAGDDHPAIGEARNHVPASEERGAHKRRETVAYNWETHGIEVSFYRQDSDSHWTMTVRDSWSVIVQALGQKGEKIWGSTDGKCSMQECLRIIDQSLADFHAEKPAVKLESVDIEMHIIKGLWGEILTGLGRRLSTLNGEKSAGRFDVPPEIEETVQNVVDESPTTTAIKALLRKHGMSVASIAMSEHVMFKDSLTGRKWSDIANLPGVGILAPGTVEFDLAESRAGATSKPGAGKPALSQSAQQ